MADSDRTAFAQWLVDNQDKKGAPEFETVAGAFKALDAKTQPSRKERIVSLASEAGRKAFEKGEGPLSEVFRTVAAEGLGIGSGAFGLSDRFVREKIKKQVPDATDDELTTATRAFMRAAFEQRPVAFSAGFGLGAVGSGGAVAKAGGAALRGAGPTGKAISRVLTPQRGQFLSNVGRGAVAGGGATVARAPIAEERLASPREVALGAAFGGAIPTLFSAGRLVASPFTRRIPGFRRGAAELEELEGIRKFDPDDALAKAADIEEASGGAPAVLAETFTPRQTARIAAQAGRGSDAATEAFEKAAKELPQARQARLGAVVESGGRLQAPTEATARARLQARQQSALETRRLATEQTAQTRRVGATAVERARAAAQQSVRAVREQAIQDTQATTASFRTARRALMQARKRGSAAVDDTIRRLQKTGAARFSKFANQVRDIETRATKANSQAASNAAAKVGVILGRRLDRTTVVLDKSDIATLLDDNVQAKLPAGLRPIKQLRRGFLLDALRAADETGISPAIVVKARDLDNLRIDLQTAGRGTGSAANFRRGRELVTDLLDSKLPGVKTSIARIGRIRDFADGALAAESALASASGRADLLEELVKEGLKPSAQNGLRVAGTRTLQQRSQSQAGLKRLMGDLLNDDYLRRVRIAIGDEKTTQLRIAAERAASAPTLTKAALDRLKTRIGAELADIETGVAAKTEAAVAARVEARARVRKVAQEARATVAAERRRATTRIAETEVSGAQKTAAARRRVEASRRTLEAVQTGRAALTESPAELTSRLAGLTPAGRRIAARVTRREVAETAAGGGPASANLARSFVQDVGFKANVARVLGGREAAKIARASGAELQRGEALASGAIGARQGAAAAAKAADEIAGVIDGVVLLGGRGSGGFVATVATRIVRLLRVPEQVANQIAEDMLTGRAATAIRRLKARGVSEDEIVRIYRNGATAAQQAAGAGSPAPDIGETKQ